MGGYDRFIFSLFYVLHVSVVHQFVSYVQSCHIIRYLMSVPARYMLYICVFCLQSCCFVCSFLLVTDMKYIPFQVFIFIVIHDLHEFQMIYDSTCSFTMNIINIIVSMINNSLYVIIMLLIYGIKMTWKLPIILTAPPLAPPPSLGPGPSSPLSSDSNFRPSMLVVYLSPTLDHIGLSTSSMHVNLPCPR